MQPFRRPHPWFRLVLIVCLASGILGYIPAIVPGAVALADPPPPSDEPPPGESEVAADVQPPAPSQPVASDPPPVPHTIRLKSRQFQPSAPDVQSLRQLARADRERVHILVQLDFIPRQVAKTEMETRGLKLLAYVPDYAWIASAPATSPDAVLDLPGVTWAGELTVDDKLDPAIRADKWGSWNLASDGTAAVYVSMHKDESLETGHKLVEAHGGKVTGEVYGINMQVVEMPRDNIRALAAEEAVQWIEPAAPPLDETNDGIRPQIGVDVVNGSPYNLDGTGVDVLVYDSGRAGTHVDFGSRLTWGDTDDIREHSTHVAGTVGGDGSNSASQDGSALQWRGMAPNVDIISYGYEWDETGVLFYSNVGDIEADWAAAQNTYGADIGTASLGSNIYHNRYIDPAYTCDLMGKYGDTSVLMDQIVRGGNSTVGIGDKYIATWAAGNERGWGSASCGTYSIVAPPAAAKNPIHVGGSNTNNNTQYAHTSWGPTEDGRIKPIVTAGGCQTSGDLGITSTDNNPVDDYTTMCGTSMATPAVAGGIALMLQHYRDVYNTSGKFWPSTAKAILMQTAVDFGNPGPDYQWGYGQVDIHAAVDLISRKAFRQDSVSQGDVDVYYFIVPNDDDDVTVSLAWDDYETTENANPALTNDLDLELVAPDGTIWRPWILDPDNPTDDATRGVNGVDNQEQVQVPSASVEIGTWLVRVKGTTVPQGPQDYSLACEGCKPLNVGVCQDKVSGGSTMALAMSEVEGPELDIEGPVPPTQPPALSAGELWQRALEAQQPPEVEAAAEREAALQEAMATLETARETGPEAVVALADTLRGPALDLAMEEIEEAQEQLAESAPPPPDTAPVSEAEEQAALEAQQAIEAANRAQGLTRFDDPAEGQVRISESANQRIAGTAGPMADLTVGNGCTYATIAAAISAANPGDRLLIEGGVTFVENIVINKNLTLEGGYNGCASGSSARTTIDGNASGRVFEIHSGLDVTLQNLNVTNGSTGNDGGGIRFAAGVGSGALNLANVDVYANTATFGGGLWVGKDAEVVGTAVEIYNNTATAYGGGVRLYGGRATFSNYSNIYDNDAPLGGGVYATEEGGCAPSLDLPSYADVHDNQALTGEGLGGGVYMREGSLSLTDSSDILYNDAVHGGGAYLVTSTLTINGQYSEIGMNTATGSGGGVYAQGSAINLDDDAELYYNDAGTDGSGSGGGAYLDDSDLYSDKATIRDNTADDYGGGVYATNGSIVDMDLGGYTCLGVRCSRLYYNTATDLYGGGIYANGSTVDLRNIFVERNTANLGGGIYAYNSTVYAHNDLFARNNGTGGTGDGVRLYTGSSMSGQGNTLAYNDAGGASTGRAIDMASSNLTLDCSVIWGHTSSINDTNENVTYSDVQGGYTGEGNLDTNPLFVSSGSYDYHLQNTSPVIDRCLSGPSTDFDNEKRPIVRTTGASPYDMGADEVSGVDRVGVNGACAYATIQQAVNAAGDGDTVRVAEGVYFENVDVSGKDITIEGGYDSACTVTGAGTTRIEGSAGFGSTLDVYYGTVTLSDIDIAWGNTTGGGLDARDGAQVTLDNVDVFNNHGSSGGGIYVSSSSVVTITNGSELYDNTATSAGGGARVYGQFFGYDETSDTYNNCAPDGGGFYVPGGELYLDDADVYSNQAADTDGKGGGIYVTSGGEVNLTNDVFVGTQLFAPSQEAYDGGGIYADNSTVFLDGVDFGANSATHYGGGLYLANNSMLQAANTRLGHTIWFFITLQYGNSANYGAGLYAEGSTVDFSGSIATNNAAYSGGGIYATGSTLNLTGATVGLLGSALGNRLGTSGHYGAGLYLDDTQATLSNTVVTSNTFQTSGYTYGGGAYLTGGSTLTLTNSRVEDHLAPSAGDGRGAGIYVSDSTVTLDNSQVISNTAGTVGGGLRLHGASTLNVLNGSSVSHNESVNGEGGGIAATGTPDVNISDSTLQHNTAGTDGGAIYLNAGTLDFTGWWDLRWNRANGGDGGAVAVTGSGDADFQVTDGANTSFLAVNYASGDGGALYVDSGNLVELYATSSFQLNLNTNQAGGNGGAVYADNDTPLFPYGKVQAGSNAANGNGGVFYLDGGADVWLFNYADDGPQIWVNQAVNGGAIYATGGAGVACFGAEFGGDANGNQATSGDGGAIYLNGSEMIAYNCAFRNSQATSGDGGAIYVNDSTLQVDRSYLHRNSAMRGGAIFQEGAGASAQVKNSLIYSNTVSTLYGAGIRTQGGTFTVTHVTLANNVGGAGFSSQAGSSSAAHNSIAWGNTDGGFYGTFVTATCNIDQWGLHGDNVDPLFVAPGAGEDYHLRGDSPAINRCATGLSTDLDGVSRPVGSGYDAGAYEYAYAIEFTPDNSGSGLPSSVVTYTHTLTNAGGITDTYTLSAGSSQDWAVAVNPTPTVTLGGGQSTPVTVSVTIPAGILSDTVDTAVVTATSGADTSLTASVTDTTTVGFEPGAAFAPDHTTTGATPNTTYTYTHWLTNTGNHADTFNLAFASSAGWGSLLDPGPFVLDVGASATVRVTVTVPSDGNGQSDTSVVTATSDGGAGPATVTDITSAFNPGVEFTPDHTQTVSPDNTFTYTHYLTNTGTSTDTFHLTPLSTLGWGTLLDAGPFTLVADEATTVRVRVVVPPDSGGLTDTTSVTATSSGGAGPAVVRDTTATFAPGIAFTPDYSQTVPAGDSITYTHRLTNTGAGPDTFDVGVASSSQGWATLVDTGPFALNADEATDVRVRVDAPFGSGGLTDVTVVTATSRSGSLSGLSVSVTDTTTAIRTYGVTFTPHYSRAISPGDSVTYTHWLTNAGNGTDKFHLAFNSSQGWASVLDPGPFKLTAGQGVSVHVHVEAPSGSGGLVDVAATVATSQLSPTVSASVTDTTTSVYTPSIVLTPDYSQTVAPGDSITYTHWLTNAGNGTDKFYPDLTSSQSWATLLDSGPFKLSAGEGVTINVRVDVPPGSGGLVEKSVVSVDSEVGGLSAAVTDTTTISHTPGVDIGPDWEQSVPPGETHVHLHTLHNTGDGDDTFTVTMSSSLGWATLLDTGPFALDAGATTEVRVSVEVPPGLISGTLTDVAVVTATSYADPSLFDTATDTTTVGFAPGVVFVQDEFTIGALPGETYTYTHYLTNTSNYTDTFNLDFASSAGWGSLLDSGPFDLAIDESTTVRVTVTVPITGDGLSDLSVVTVTSQGGAGPVRVRDVTAAFTPGVAFAPDYSQVLNPGEAYTYTHWLTNTGTSTDTFELSMGSSWGWTTLVDPGPFTLAADEPISVRVRVDAPLGSGGLTDVTVVTATTLFGVGPSAAVTDTTSVPYTPGIALSPDYTQTVPVGSSVIYHHILTNTGNGPDTFSVALHSSQGWGALLDTGPFTLTADADTIVRVQVTVPTDTYALIVDVTTITATAALGGISATATDTTTVACEPLFGPDFTFDPPTAQAGQGVTFTGTVAAGSEPVTYLWDFGDNSGVQTGNPISHTFTTSNTFTMVMTATNLCSGPVTATHDIVVTSAPGEPDITVSPLSLSATLNLDGVTTQTLTVSNMATATADLSWSLAESPAVTWLSESPVGGTIAPAGSTPVGVVFDATGQVTGTYTTTLRIASNDPDESPVSIPVTLTVTAAPPHRIYLPVVLRNHG